jgi:hypothetical protein
MTDTQRLRRTVLTHADHLTSDTRADQYGDATQGFTRIAHLWSAMFETQFTPADVALAMILVKAARLDTNQTHYDSWVDIAGYAALGAEAAGAQANTETDEEHE